MTDAEALITTARRYLITNHTYWTGKYANERTGDDFPYSYTDSDYDLFPRYNVLAAILDKVETLTGQIEFDFESCKQELQTIGLAANSILTIDEQNKIAINAMQEERNKFNDFIQNISVRDVTAVEPLAYRRGLGNHESQKVRQMLLTHWNFQGIYWEPIEKLSPKPTIFLLKDMITNEDYEQIIKEVKKHSNENLFEITEGGSDAEIEFSLFHPDCYETIYCDSTYKWIIYGSHESTIAFGGDWLLKFIRDLYKDRQNKLNIWRKTYKLPD